VKDLTGRAAGHAGEEKGNLPRREGVTNKTFDEAALNRERKEIVREIVVEGTGNKHRTILKPCRMKKRSGGGGFSPRGG